MNGQSPRPVNLRTTGFPPTTFYAAFISVIASQELSQTDNAPSRRHLDNSLSSLYWPASWSSPSDDYQRRCSQRLSSSLVFCANNILRIRVNMYPDVNTRDDRIQAKAHVHRDSTKKANNGQKNLAATARPNILAVDVMMSA